MSAATACGEGGHWEPAGASRLLKNDASPSGHDGQVREKDAGSANSGAICATEDTVSCRPVRPDGRGFVGQQPPSPFSPAADPRAPYVRLAVVGLICRADESPDTRGVGAGAGDAGDATADHGAARGSAAGGDGFRWLLLHRTQPFEAWDPPGGRMEAGEDLARAVKREVREETGLDVEVGGPCYAFLTFYQGERLLAVSMACRPAGDPDDIRLEPGGAGGWRWVSAQEWKQLAAGRASVRGTPRT